MTPIKKQTTDPRWGAYAEGLVAGKFRKPRSGKNNDEAHPPIHPVRAAVNLEGDEKKLFEFIARRFLACCSDEAKGSGTTVTMIIGGESFTATGLVVLERNYLEVYPFENWSGCVIGRFTVGQRVGPSVLRLQEGATTKPELLTEADLIGVMDKAGIGTDATIHEHIKKILERDYANKDGDHFLPTVLGMALVKGYDKMDIEISLSKPDLRALMERNMKLICNGEKGKDQVIREVGEMYRHA